MSILLEKTLDKLKNIPNLDAVTNREYKDILNYISKYYESEKGLEFRKVAKIEELPGYAWQFRNEIKENECINWKNYIKRSAIPNLIKQNTSKIKIVRLSEAELLVCSDAHIFNTIESKELKANVATVLNSLSAIHKIIIKEKYYNCKTYKEIADKLGLSVERISTELSKALRIIKSACISEKSFTNIINNIE